MNVKFDTLADGTDRTDRPGNWQVIFKTQTGLDYCRETKPGTMSRDKIKQWTEVQCLVHGLNAVIEKW